ncbi:PEP-CTERM sorting domain-containing protein [Photobacterium sp. BZF1]|uniref:PEP-CTERM sorting domain-containing protein n=1 Tax=Photobacterium sp. BZF1 TaxID=1904457 RepID=UPI00165354B1|nr:PEP-CTERM sorting domain-containing protein [Photobacterium sp. BZF1]MBC7004128.1 PEP-CTERM sorting domain-containing protein [Photobacterium sp. BZF1]
MKTYPLLIGLGLTALVGSANATVIYNVSDATTGAPNCGSSPHGLWTNKLKFSGGSCGQYFSIANGTFTLFNDDIDPSNWTASLMFTAFNDIGDKAEVDLSFGSFGHTGTVKGGQDNGGASDDPALPQTTQTVGSNDVDFFYSITQSEINFFDSGDNSLGSFTDISLFGGENNQGYAFQFGVDANDKNDLFGGAAWLRYDDTRSNMNKRKHRKYWGKNHWDINLAFAEVPEPSTLAIFAAGLFGFGVYRRKDQSR